MPGRCCEQDESTVKNAIFVVEDQAVMRQAIVESLERETDLSVCGEAEGLSAALTAIQKCSPDLVLADIQLKASNGIDLIRELRRRYPTLPIIAMTMFDPVQYEKPACAAGANRLVVKQNGMANIIQEIRNALK